MNDVTTHNAEIEWDDEGQPLSKAFGDIYFSKANGLAETRHVFLHHNQLAERWACVAQDAQFIIGETGFGSGLNFLAAWDLWEKIAPAKAQLHFVSVEKYPLHKDDLIRALALWPELKHLADRLIESYPVFIGTGFHRITFMNGRVRLTLIIDDAAEGFSQLLASTHPLFSDTGIKMDAWFLDGFAPSKNPQMWSDHLFHCIAQLSRQGTTAATFSAAAIVKKGLISAGFSLEKVAGFGRKRDMVKAIFTRDAEQKNPHDYVNRRSFSPYPVPWTINPNRVNATEKTAIILGGGLAGCHTARALAERGWRIILLEKNTALAQEGSGNPQGVLYAKLSHKEEAQAAFNLASLHYALNFYRPLWDRIGEKCGVLQLAFKPSETELHSQLREKFSQAKTLVEFVNANEASQRAGIALTQSGLYFPEAGWINPRQLCDFLADHPLIDIHLNSEAAQLKYRDDHWQVTDTHGNTQQAPVCIFANAKDAAHFSLTNHLPIKTIRGQVSYIPAKDLSPSDLQCVVCAEGYIAPQDKGLFCMGATFNLNDKDAHEKIADHQINIDNLREHLPALTLAVDAAQLKGRVAFRCTLPDYLPAVGPLPDVDQLVEDFAPLRKNAKAGIAVGGTYHPGLFINIGHGARGLAYTPLCAELLAAEINHEPAPLPRELVNALHPARFIIRDITRNKR